MLLDAAMRPARRLSCAASAFRFFTSCSKSHFLSFKPLFLPQLKVTFSQLKVTFSTPVQSHFFLTQSISRFWRVRREHLAARPLRRPSASL